VQVDHAVRAMRNQLTQCLADFVLHGAQVARDGGFGVNRNSM
jgi:hypothetical protein